MPAALFLGLSFMLHECPQGVHLLINGFDSWVVLEETVSSYALLRCEFLGRFAQDCQTTAAVAYFRGDRTHQLDAVLVDQAHSMEAVGYDFGTGEPLSNESSVWTG